MREMKTGRKREPQDREKQRKKRESKDRKQQREKRNEKGRIQRETEGSRLLPPARNPRGHHR